MKAKVKKKTIIEIYTALVGILGDRDNQMEGMVEKLPFKFSYALNRTKSALKDEIEALQKAEKDESAEFNKERLALCEAFAEINEEGKPVKINGEFKISKDKSEAFAMKYGELAERYKPSLDKIKEMLKEDCEADLFKVKIEDVPDLPAKYVTGISYLVIEPEEKKAE